MSEPLYDLTPEDIKTKYEEISFSEAVDRLEEGEVVFTLEKLGIYEHLTAYRMNGSVLQYLADSSEDFKGRPIISLETALRRPWYIVKPFDVREAMIENPDKWVGAICINNDGVDEWRFVGFDSKNFCAVIVKPTSKFKLSKFNGWNGGNTLYAGEDELSKCISILDYHATNTESKY